MPGDGAQVGKAYVRVSPDTKGFGKELSSQVDNESSTVSKAFGGVGKAAAAAFSLGAIGAGIAGVAMFKIGTQTEEALNIFQAAAGATGEQMEKVSSLARDLGNDIMLPGASAKDAALAMSELAKAGLTVDEAMAAAKGTLQLAAAAGIDAASAATISGNALNAFGLEATEAGRVADLLAGAANSASGEITDVAQAFAASSSVYAAAGISIEDLTTSIALMANKGIIGSDAGTSLKTMLLSLQSPSDKAKGVLDDLGISIYDASGNMNDFHGIVDQFGKVLPTLTDAQRDEALATIFGTDAVRAANIVLGEGVEAFDAMKGSVTEQGAAQKIAEARMKGLGGAVEGLKSMLETLALDGFNLLAPYAEAFVRWLAVAMPVALKAAGDALTWFGENVVEPTIKLFKDNWPDIKAVGVAVFDWFTKNWPTISDVFESVWETLQAGFQWLIDHKPVLIAIFIALAAIIVGPFVTAVAGAIIAYQKFDGVRQVIDATVRWITQSAVPAIQQAWGWIKENTQALVLYIQERWASIQKAIDNVVTYLKVVVAVALAPILLIWQAAHDQILGIAMIVWENIRLVVETAINVIKGIIDVVIGLLSGDWGMAWDGIKQIAQAAWDFMIGTVTLGIEAIKLVVEGVLLILQAIWSAAWGLIQGALSTAWETMKMTVSTGIANVVAFLQGLPGQAVAALASLGAILAGVASAALASMYLAVTAGATTVINYFMGLPAKIVEIIGDLSRLLYDIGASILTGLVDGAKSALGGVKDFFGGIAGGITDWKGPADYDAVLLVPAGQMIMQGLIDGSRSMMGQVRKFYESVGMEISSAVDASVAANPVKPIWTVSSPAPPVGSFQAVTGPGSVGSSYVGSSSLSTLEEMFGPGTDFFDPDSQALFGRGSDFANWVIASGEWRGQTLEAMFGYGSDFYTALTADLVGRGADFANLIALPPGAPLLSTGAFIKDAMVAQLHPNEVVLNNRQAARVMWALANGAVTPRGGEDAQPLVVNNYGVATDPQHLARLTAEETTWALRTRAA